MMILSMELTEDAEKGTFGVRVGFDSIVAVAVSEGPEKSAGVFVAGGVIDGNKVAVGETYTVAVGVQVGFNCIGVIVKVGYFGLYGLSGFSAESGLAKIIRK